MQKNTHFKKWYLQIEEREPLQKFVDGDVEKWASWYFAFLLFAEVTEIKNMTKILGKIKVHIETLIYGIFVVVTKKL